MGRRPDIDGRELLLEAALKLFAEQGIEGVSIRAVNREAGLGPASVHYHFGTKEALLDAVLHRYGDVVIDRVKARAKELAEPADDAPTLATWCHARRAVPRPGREPGRGRPRLGEADEPAAPAGPRAHPRPSVGHA